MWRVSVPSTLLALLLPPWLLKLALLPLAPFHREAPFASLRWRGPWPRQVVMFRGSSHVWVVASLTFVQVLAVFWVGQFNLCHLAP